MYIYSENKSFIFTEEGSLRFLKIRDKVINLLDIAGSFQMHKAIVGVGGGSCWDLQACVDRLVEIGEIKELKRDCAGQYRTFVKFDQ